MILKAFWIFAIISFVCFLRKVLVPQLRALGAEEEGLSLPLVDEHWGSQLEPPFLTFHAVRAVTASVSWGSKPIRSQ